jgi:PQQ-like domain
MNKKLATSLIIILILIFIGYIVYDVAFNKEKTSQESNPVKQSDNKDEWRVSATIDPASGKVKAVGVMRDGNILIAGDSFFVCYDSQKKLLWNRKTDKPLTAISVSGDTIYASTIETVREFNRDGEQIAEWGPFEDNSIITSVASNNSYILFADAGNKIIIVLDKKGNLKSMIGKTGEPFIIPSPYFDVAIDHENNIFVANTGNRRIEKRDLTGKVLWSFGEPGTAPDAFCGCCNPAHFALIPGGFVTAEKGINRIKILNAKGEFTEFVSSVNDFVPSLPLDVASSDGKIIYGANTADSKVYAFTRK